MGCRQDIHRTQQFQLYEQCWTWLGCLPLYNTWEERENTLGNKQNSLQISDLIYQRRNLTLCKITKGVHWINLFLVRWLIGCGITYTGLLTDSGNTIKWTNHWVWQREITWLYSPCSLCMQTHVSIVIVILVTLIFGENYQIFGENYQMQHFGIKSCDLNYLSVKTSIINDLISCD